MAEHELPEITNPKEDYITAAHAAALDNGGFSHYEIDHQTGVITRGRRLNPSIPRDKPHRVSHSGGRGHRLPSESEVDEHWNIASPLPLSDEQKEVNRHGVELVRRALAGKKFDSEVRAARDSGIALMALQRARADKAERQRSSGK